MSKCKNCGGHAEGTGAEYCNGCVATYGLSNHAPSTYSSSTSIGIYAENQYLMHIALKESKIIELESRLAALQASHDRMLWFFSRNELVDCVALSNMDVLKQIFATANALSAKSKEGKE